MGHFLALALIPADTPTEKVWDTVLDLVAPHQDIGETYWGEPIQECTKPTMFDWCRFGGRYDGYLGEGNVCIVRDIPKEKGGYAIVTPDGKWHSREIPGTWNDKPADEWDAEHAALLAASPDYLAVAVDCHC